jgi:hypothetical protein
MADRLLAHGVVGGVLPPLRTPIELVVVDDDLGGPYPPGPSDVVARALDAERSSGTGGSRIALVFAEPRAWTGRAGLGAASRAQLQDIGGADLIVLFGHPRLAAELPRGVPVLVAWHRQRLMQEAVARWISRQSLRGAAPRG